VRWGGRIVQVEPRADSTCFEMLSTRLDHFGRPYWASDDTGGRFIACRAGFYDPAIFEVNREVTFTGRVSGYENRSIGGYSYRFPRVDADVVYLWPERARNLITRPAPWPWWGYW
jgi:outer membrane lipoprotein